jgi:hypothetical protein
MKVTVGDDRMQKVVFRHLLQDLGEGASCEQQQPGVRCFPQSKGRGERKVVQLIDVSRTHVQIHSHAALIERREDVRKVIVVCPEALAIIEQQQATLSRLVMMSVAVLYEKIEN